MTKPTQSLGRPSWLDAALAGHPVPAQAPPHYEPAAPGQVRRLDAMNSDGPNSRLVVVQDVDVASGTVRVALLSPETAMASTDDRMLPRQQSGLTFDLLVELDVTGPAWLIQLGPVLATADLDVIAMAPSGASLRDERDSRWTWKEQELDAFAALTVDCLRQVIDGPPATVVDPVCMNPDVTSRVDLRHIAVHVARCARQGKALLSVWPLVPAEDGTGGLSRWRDAVEPDTLKVLTSAALRGAALYTHRHANPVAATITGRKVLHDDPLVALLSAQVLDGARCLRVLTTTGLWELPAELADLPGAALEVTVRGIRCQLMWDAVDAPSGALHG